MPYFDMRQRSSSGRSYILAVILGLGILYFLFSLSAPSSLDPYALVRKRRASAAAANPLSPPTSAYRRTNDPPGVRRPPPVVHYQLNNLTATSSPLQNEEKILVLTPLARFYQGYWDNLVKLTYPHEHISLGFIIPKTAEGEKATVALNEAIKTTQSGPEPNRFQSVTILRQDFEPPLTSQDEAERHKMQNQKPRRAAMSRARNSLLFTTIGPSTSWVLWLDSDIVETPPSLIEDLTSHDKPIVVPNCFQRYVDENGDAQVRPYDYNSWVDSESARRLAADMGKDDILLEGYAEMATYRTLMAMLGKPSGGDPRRLMALDGVGGTALMVKAEVHRDGAMFPPFPFYNLIETEGFAKMAMRLGYKSWGLPDYLVYHYNE
jgi:mannan polymerase complexes MNN9 subunit